MHKVLGVIDPMRYDSGPRIMTLHHDARYDCVITRIIIIPRYTMMRVMTRVMTLHHGAHHSIAL